MKLTIFSLVCLLNIIFANGSEVNLTSGFMPNGSPILAGFWEEGSHKVWKCTQNGNLFTWTMQDKSARIAKGVIIAKSPEPKSTDWLVFITFDNKDIHWELTFNTNFTTLIGKNDVFKKIDKPLTMKVFIFIRLL